MAKTAEKTVKKSDKPICECGQELRWVKHANSGVMVLYCEKCQTMTDRKGNKKS